jgi:hypothetical protein
MRDSLILGCVCLAASSFADEAVFSADGNSVTFVPKNFEANHLWKLDIGTGKVEKIALGGAVAKEGVTSLCLGGEGELLLTTGEGVYVQDDKGTRKLAPAPVKGNLSIKGLAVAPASAAAFADWLFLSGEDAEIENHRILYSRKPGTKAFVPMFIRRVNRVHAAAFALNGRFFFGGDGDLWEGGFEDMGDGEVVRLGLIGARIAPLGFFNTGTSNGGSMYVDQIMVAGEALYVRLRGHHLSELVRVPMPAASALDEKDAVMSDPAASYRLQSQLLSKAEVIPTQHFEITISAATAVGGNEFLFFRANDDDGIGLYLWDRQSGRAKRVASEISEE